VSVNGRNTEAFFVFALTGIASSGFGGGFGRESCVLLFFDVMRRVLCWSVSWLTRRAWLFVVR